IGGHTGRGPSLDGACPAHVTFETKTIRELTAAEGGDAEHGAVLPDAVEETLADALDRGRRAQPQAARRRPGLVQRNRGVPAHRGLGDIGLRPSRTPTIGAIDIALQRPTDSAVGAADIRHAAAAPLAGQLGA